MTPKDERLQRSIEIVRLEVYSSGSPKERRAAMDRLRILADQQSAEARRLDTESDND